MKYLSLDIETTGLDPKLDQILMISAVVEDTENLAALEELPHFTVYVKHVQYKGSAYALQMNHKILEKIAKEDKSSYKIMDEYDMLINLQAFIYNHFGDQAVTVAGKNAARFDLRFLEELMSRTNPCPIIKFKHRVLDAGSVFWDGKGEIKDLKSLKESLGIRGEVAHDAYEDALDVIKCLRKKYAN